MRVVFDTNIYIAAAKAGGLAAALLHKVLNKENDLLLFSSKEIIDEFQRKLEFFVSKNLISAHAANLLFSTVISAAHIIVASERIQVVKSDPDDDKILECAAAAEADIIVSMDKHLLKLKQFRNIPILHPKTFSRILPER